MISDNSQTEQSKQRGSLWGEYAQQLILIHAGCSLMWWTLTLITKPSIRLLAMVCSLASGWILIRQCIRRNHYVDWTLVVSLAIFSLLVWQHLHTNVHSSEANNGIIFKPWILLALLVVSEIVSFQYRGPVDQSSSHSFKP